jgi:hypothetical protein
VLCIDAGHVTTTKAPYGYLYLCRPHTDDFFHAWKELAFYRTVFHQSGGQPIGVPGGENRVTITNANFVTQGHNVPWAIGVNTEGTSGVQRVFGIKGDFKCVVCDQYVEDDAEYPYTKSSIICAPCRQSINWVREARESADFLKLLEYFKEGRLGIVLELMSDDVFRQYFAKLLEEMRDADN